MVYDSNARVPSKKLVLSSGTELIFRHLLCSQSPLLQKTMFVGVAALHYQQCRVFFGCVVWC